MMGRWALPSLLIALAVVLSVACGDGGADRSLRLDDRVDGATVRRAPELDGTAGTLRIAIAGVMSPSRTLDAYDQLLSYLKTRLDMQITVDQRSSYAEVNDLIRTGQADIAFVCSRAYLEGREQFGLQLFLAPEVGGSLSYYSYLVVPAASSATSLSDLRGKLFAFSDPLSNTGKLVPEYQLLLRGETPNTFFRRYEYTGSHDNSILAVADRLVDGAAVDSLVYDYIVQRNPEIGARTRVIARWGPYGIPPLVVSPTLDVQLRGKIERALLDMNQDEDGLMALAALGVDRFVPISDSAYDSIRAMVAALKAGER